ncbi:CapA family protein [Candidatus Parcubacteria bacterium]|nr:MAG: CapA family protein [Candidatus Parcubacteria bacterium]
MRLDNNKTLILFLILLITMAGLIYIWIKYENSQFLTTKIKEASEYVAPKEFIPRNIVEEKEHNWLFFGDLMLDRNVGSKIEEQGIDYIFENILAQDKNFFTDYELISANLEGAVTNQGEHYLPNAPYDFAFSPGLIKDLKEKYNFNFFTIANNHITDQGNNGLIETRENLNQLGIGYVGCADAQVADCSAKIIDKKDYKLGMLGFSMVYHMLDTDAASKLVSQMASSTDFVIVNIHWGVEYEHQFNNIQQNLAHTLIDSGADMIVGHHPHVVQGMEIYQEKPIFYSLGNFVFDQYFSSDTQEELALKINYKNDQLNIQLIPLVSENSQIRLANENEKQEFLNKFFLWSEADIQYHEAIISANISL